MFMLAVDNGQCWGCWQTWLTIPIWVGWTIFNMIMQIAMVPNIFDWAANAPINPNKKENTKDDSEENFLAAF